MIVKRKNISSLYKICFTYFILVVFGFHFMYNSNINSNQIQECVSTSVQEKFTITSKKISFPTEADLQDLEKSYNEIINSLNTISELLNDTKQLYQEVKNAKVCSKANKYFKSLAKLFYMYKEQISEVQNKISLFEEQYTLYLDSISEIPEFSVLHSKMYDEFAENFKPKYEFVLSKRQEFSVDENFLHDLYLEAEQIADSLFEEYFTLMCKIVNAEAGSNKCTPMERCYVANVIENRIANDIYPNNIHDVVYSPGQYAPVKSGSINKRPSKEVIDIIEKYLRGEIETGMPDNVLYQALFKQGEVWKEMPSGHFFCY